MTIKEICYSQINSNVFYYKMEEDINENNNCGWNWYPNAIERFVSSSSYFFDEPVISVTDKIHLGGTTNEIVTKFNHLVNTGIIDISLLNLVTVKYDTSKNNLEEGPVRLYFVDGTVVILNLTAGYGGAGPNATCEVLKMCDLDGYEPDDILTHQDIVNLRYTRGTSVKFVDYYGNEL